MIEATAMLIQIRFTVALLLAYRITGDAILVIDAAKSLEPSQFEFFLHPNAEASSKRTGRDLRVRQNGTVTDVYMNLEADGSVRHRNANLEMPNGWETDAYLFAFTYPEGADPNDPDAITRTRRNPRIQIASAAGFRLQGRGSREIPITSRFRLGPNERRIGTVSGAQSSTSHSDSQTPQDQKILT